MYTFLKREINDFIEYLSKLLPSSRLSGERMIACPVFEPMGG